MSVPKKTINEVVDEALNNLISCKNLLNNLKNTEIGTYPESILLHLIMLRTEIAGMGSEIDSMQHILENYDLDNNDFSKKYELLIRKKWYIFELDDTVTRQNLNEMLNIYNND